MASIRVGWVAMSLDTISRQFATARLIQSSAATFRFPQLGVNALTTPRKTALTTSLFTGAASLLRATGAARKAGAAPFQKGLGFRPFM